MTDFKEAYQTISYSSKYPIRIGISPNEIMKQYYNTQSDIKFEDNTLYDHTYSNYTNQDYPKEDSDLMIYSSWKPKTKQTLMKEEIYPEKRIPMKPTQQCIYRADARIVCPFSFKNIDNKEILAYQNCTDSIQLQIAEFFFLTYKHQYKGINSVLRLQYYFRNFFIGGNTLLVALDHGKLYGTIGIDTQNISRVHLSHLSTFDKCVSKGFRTMITIGENYCKQFDLYQRMYLYTNRDEIIRNESLGFQYETEEQTKYGWKILMYRMIPFTSCF